MEVKWFCNNLKKLFTWRCVIGDEILMFSFRPDTISYVGNMYM